MGDLVKAGLGGSCNATTVTVPCLLRALFKKNLLFILYLGIVDLHCCVTF